jgi:methionine synthase II (cobalamin-independent)
MDSQREEALAQKVENVMEQVANGGLDEVLHGAYAFGKRVQSTGVRVGGPNIFRNARD